MKHHILVRANVIINKMTFIKDIEEIEDMKLMLSSIRDLAGGSDAELRR